MVSVSKNFLVILLVLSTITLCLARRRWVWLREEEKNGENLKDEVLAREVQNDDQNLIKEWKKSKTGTANCHSQPVCNGGG